jgi:6-phosphogluconolactonase
MRLIVADDAPAAARLAADEVTRVAQAACARRGRALLAFSGGETPWLMLAELRTRDLDWAAVHVVQVDERIAPAADARRNFSRLDELLVRQGPLPAAHLHAMPVEAQDVARGAAAYQAALEAQFGRPLCLDLVQLGLGSDGHTASLVPGDDVLQVHDRDVAITSQPYQELRRMTLTYPALSRARERLWLVTGAAKAARLQELLTGAGMAPAIRVSREHATVIADAAAAPSPGLRPAAPG